MFLTARTLALRLWPPPFTSYFEERPHPEYGRNVRGHHHYPIWASSMLAFQIRDSTPIVSPHLKLAKHIIPTSVCFSAQDPPSPKMNPSVPERKKETK